MTKEHTDFYILRTIESNSSVSQRNLSSQMELNVASVNFALKRLIRKGFVRMIGANPRRIKYYITPEGLKEKTKLAYRFFGRNIHFYKEIRNDIETRIAKATNGNKTNIAIYGAGEISEITYMVISKMRCNFVGFFLEEPKNTNERVLGYKIQKLDQLKAGQPCLLLLTEKLPDGTIYDMVRENFETLNLVEEMGTGMDNI